MNPVVVIFVNYHYIKQQSVLPKETITFKSLNYLVSSQ